VYVDVQIPNDNVQDAVLNVPPALPSLSNIVPDGVVGEIELSETDIESVTCTPAFTVVGFDVMLVAVL